MQLNAVRTTTPIINLYSSKIKEYAFDDKGHSYPGLQGNQGLIFLYQSYFLYLDHIKMNSKPV